MAIFSVWLDKKDQLICQRIEGVLSVQEFQQLLALTGECVAKLDNPGDVRILVDARTMVRTGVAARKVGMSALEEKKVTRMALWGAPPMERTVHRFMMAIVGEKRLRTFATEEQARAWLKESPGAKGGS